MCIWKKSGLGQGCCVMKADLLTARLSAWNTKRQCFSWIGFKQRQSNFGMTISWGGLWWLAQYVSGYFGWLWLMVFLGNQTHKRPMRLWPASLAGQGKEGWIKRTTKTDKKREGVRKAATACQMQLITLRTNVISAAFSLSMRSASDSSPRDGVREKQGAATILKHIEPNRPVALPELLFCLLQIGGPL